MGSAWISTSPPWRRYASPNRLEGLRVRQQVAVAQHRALAAPGGAAGVEDGGQVVGAACGTTGRGGRQHEVRSALQQRAGAVVVEREHMRHAGLERELADPAGSCAGAHHHRRLGVANEVLNLGTAGRPCSAAKTPARRATWPGTGPCASTDFSTCTATRECRPCEFPATASKLAIMALARSRSRQLNRTSRCRSPSAISSRLAREGLARSVAKRLALGLALGEWDTTLFIANY